MGIFSYQYTNDNGISMNIQLKDTHAAAAGFSLSENPEWPQLTRRQRQKMRGLYLRSTITGRRTFLPYPTNTSMDEAFASGSVSIAGDASLVTSRRGEFWKRVI